MEPHKELSAEIDAWRPDLTAGPIGYFQKAWKFANHFYGDEIRRISTVRFDDVSSDFFFREYIWVVHATGFSAKAVGKFMPRLVEAYGTWRFLSEKPLNEAIDRVKVVCNNPQKIRAIHQMAKILSDNIGNGASDPVIAWNAYKDRWLSSPDKLSSLPYIGKVTCYHLGRNIGLLECVKPDLHLIRMAEHWGFKDCESMCRWMRTAVDSTIPLGIVDLALWYAASTFGTLEIKKEGQR